MPLNFGEVGYSYKTTVAVSADIVFKLGKGFGK
jgi:hypothetical protein